MTIGLILASLLTFVLGLAARNLYELKIYSVATVLFTLDLAAGRAGLADYLQTRHSSVQLDGAVPTLVSFGLVATALLWTALDGPGRRWYARHLQGFRTLRGEMIEDLQTASQVVSRLERQAETNLFTTGIITDGLLLELQRQRLTNRRLLEGGAELAREQGEMRRPLAFPRDREFEPLEQVETGSELESESGFGQVDPHYADRTTPARTPYAYVYDRMERQDAHQPRHHHG